ncbi:MAG: prolyl oligopeptidase family serine peptidase [Pseudomonadota bacterium]|nr:prolyl oligopeptidase family serine peptidase [Pseudomonadota bacterium]
MDYAFTDAQRRMPIGLGTLCCAIGLAVAACAPLPATLTPATTDGATIAPNANLHVEGIPPVPASIAADVGKYNDFRGHAFVAWHPRRAEMLVSYRPRGGDTVQLFRVASALAEPERLTDFADPVRRASYEPLRGDYIVYERSSGGDEAAQLYRLDLPGKTSTLLTEPGQRHDMQAWLHRTSQLLYLSVPLDRTASGGSREQIAQTLTVVDPAQPQSRHRIAELPGGGWSVNSVAHDDRQATLVRFVSATQSEIWLLDLGTGSRRQVLPAPATAPPAATYSASAWKHDGSGFFVISDRAGEFRELMFYRLADASLTRISKSIPWDIRDASLDASGRLLAARVNVEGKTELRFFDAESFDELPTPRLPAGSVIGARFHRSLPLLALSLTGNLGPGQIDVLAPASGQLQAWTRPQLPPGMDTASFGEQSTIRWPSFDGRPISGLISRPPQRFSGKRPVLIDVHGGPEGQAEFGFLGRNAYFVEEMGIVIIRPNVRGSSGFGKTFLSLDDGIRREDSVKDIGALLDWIARQPDLDASRVMVTGGSYGGYVSLAVATLYSDRIAASIDVVGISDFLSFLKNTESYRRDLRRVEYGDERDPAVRAVLEQISPLRNAARIKKPLFVVAGRNDPRVPYTEAEQIVAKARQNGSVVWYLRGENEGHGFARKENSDFQFYATVLFMREYLLK